MASGIGALNRPHPGSIGLEGHELGKEIDHVFWEGFRWAWSCLEDLQSMMFPLESKWYHSGPPLYRLDSPTNESRRENEKNIVPSKKDHNY